MANPCDIKIYDKPWRDALIRLGSLIDQGVVGEREVRSALDGIDASHGNVVLIRYSRSALWLTPGRAFQQMLDRFNERADENTLSFDNDRGAFREQCAQLLPEGGGAMTSRPSPKAGEAPRSAPSPYLQENGFSEQLPDGAQR